MKLGNIEITGLNLGSNKISRAIVDSNIVYEDMSQPNSADNKLSHGLSGPWSDSETIESTGWVFNGAGDIAFDNSEKYNGYKTIGPASFSSGITGSWIVLDPDSIYLQKAMIKSNVTYSGGNDTPLHSWENTVEPVTEHDHVNYILGESMSQSVIANEWCLVYRTIRTLGSSGNRIYNFKPFIYTGNTGLDSSKVWLAWMSIEKITI